MIHNDRKVPMLLPEESYRVNWRNTWALFSELWITSLLSKIVWP